MNNRVKSNQKVADIFNFCRKQKLRVKGRKGSDSANTLSYSLCDSILDEYIGRVNKLDIVLQKYVSKW